MTASLNHRPAVPVRVMAAGLDVASFPVDATLSPMAGSPIVRTRAPADEIT